MLFVVDNFYYFQTTSFVHGINTRYNNNLHLPSCRLSTIQRGTTFSAFKIFNKLQTRISGLKNDETILNLP
jgi:hypothetical protein